MESGLVGDAPMRWHDVVGIVGDIRRVARRKGIPRWWTPELCSMRADMRRFRAAGRHEEYVLSRRVYRAELVAAKNADLGKRLGEVGQLGIFRSIDKLDLRRSIPSMMADDGTYVSSHEGIADLIVR